MRSGQANRRMGKAAILSLLAATAVSAGVALAAAPATRASDRDPFTAQLDALKTSTSLAGANPDLVFEMHRDRAGCKLGHPIEEPPTFFAGGCSMSDDPEYEDPEDFDFYVEQNLKRIGIDLGSALLPDPNATGGQFADCRRRWTAGAAGAAMEPYVFFCNPAALVGTGRIETALCFPLSQPEESAGIRRVACIPDGTDRRGERTGIALPPELTRALLYLGRPRPERKEAGRLTLAFPGVENAPGGGDAIVAVDTSVRANVTKSGIEIEAVADDIPDVYDYTIIRRRPTPSAPCRYEEEWHPPVGGVSSCIKLSRPSAQFDTVKMRLFGDRGLKEGHPLLTNSTTCERQRLGAEFQGYLNSSMWDVREYEFDQETGSPIAFRPGFGNGKTTAGSAPYQATGCEKVKFDPQIRIGLDQSDSAAQADKVLGVDATITQREREGGIGRVETEFDAAGITVNTENKVKACAPKDFDEGKCDASAVIGSVDATSPLLYENQKALTGDDPVFRGPAYLLGIKGDEVQLGLRLEGTIGTQRLSLPLTGIGKVAGGKLKVVFTNPYKVPLSSFGLHISGDKERGVLKSSRICPSSPQVTTRLTNQNGDKSVVHSQAVRIYGCKDPTFNAELSTTEAGKPTSVTLQLAGNAKLGSGSVSFDLPRELMLATKQGKQATGAQDGSIKVETPDGILQAPFAFSGQGSNLALGALKAQGNSALSGFGGALSLNSVTLPAKEVKKKAKKRKKARKASKKKQKKAKRLAIQLTSTGSGELKLQGLPQEITGAEVSLGNNARQVFLITAKSCGQVLPFTANVKTADGRSLQLKDFVRLDACEKQRATGKKKQKARKHKRQGAKR